MTYSIYFVDPSGESATALDGERGIPDYSRIVRARSPQEAVYHGLVLDYLDDVDEKYPAGYPWVTPVHERAMLHGYSIPYVTLDIDHRYIYDLDKNFPRRRQ